MFCWLRWMGNGRRGSPAGGTVRGLERPNRELTQLAGAEAMIGAGSALDCRLSDVVFIREAHRRVRALGSLELIGSPFGPRKAPA
jgi:hypothetical protein